jgi:hypothetical protein
VNWAAPDHTPYQPGYGPPVLYDGLSREALFSGMADAPAEVAMATPKRAARVGFKFAANLINVQNPIEVCDLAFEASVSDWPKTTPGSMTKIE